jgi:N-acetylglucosaminyl-diphospho-decaprenol L-rhamnosyltransferase
MNPPDLSIIIINWNSQAFVAQCLTSIRKNAGVLALEILLVDNASYDGCEEMVKSQFPDVIFIQSEQNLGFAGANNLAFVHSTGRNILFLNPDTEIQGFALQKLVSGLESLSDAGMVGAHLLNSDLSIQTTCITAVPAILNQTLNSDHLRKAFPKWKIWGMRALFEKNNNPVQVEAISGACMLGRRETIERVGVFSTDYFMYAEDMDLCVKLAKAGLKIYYIPDAMIVHYAGGSSSSLEEKNFSSIVLRESMVRFLKIHRGPLYAAIYRSSIVFISVLRIILLVVASPILIPRMGFRFLSRALTKWCSILLWSLGMARWSSQQSRIRKSQGENFEKLTEPYMTD